MSTSRKVVTAKRPTMHKVPFDVTEQTPIASLVPFLPSEDELRSFVRSRVYQALLKPEVISEIYGAPIPEDARKRKRERLTGYIRRYFQTTGLVESTGTVGDMIKRVKQLLEDKVHGRRSPLTASASPEGMAPPVVAAPTTSPKQVSKPPRTKKRTAPAPEEVPKPKKEVQTASPGTELAKMFLSAVTMRNKRAARPKGERPVERQSRRIQTKKDRKDVEDAMPDLISMMKRVGIPSPEKH